MQFFVNVTSRADRLVVTLCNNAHEEWSGTIRPRNARVRSAVNWMDDTKMRGGESVHVEVPPLDVVVIEILLDKPVFEVRA